MLWMLLSHMHARLSSCCGAAQVLQAKKRLLDKLHADVAEGEDGKLRFMLKEDEATMKRREQLTHRLKLLKRAADEVNAVY